MALETIKAKVGEDFTVHLKSTPTTGFLWTVHPLPESLELLESGYEKILGDTQAGDPVNQVFRFRALVAGDVSIHFHLKCYWNSDIVNVQIVTVYVM